MAKLKTGRHTSALKELRKNRKRAEYNRALKRRIRLLAKEVESAIAGKKIDQAKQLLSECFSAWDKAAKVGVIHKNSASRKKARLSFKLSKLTLSSAA